jgi:hypothetical protein
MDYSVNDVLAIQRYCMISPEILIAYLTEHECLAELAWLDTVEAAGNAELTKTSYAIAVAHAKGELTSVRINIP